MVIRRVVRACFGRATLLLLSILTGCPDAQAPKLQTVAPAARPDPDTVLLNEQLRIAAGQYGAWDLTLAAPRLMKFNMNVRSNQAVDYYWMAPEELEAFLEAKTGIAGGSFYYLPQFFGQGVRQANDAHSLAAGRWKLVIYNPGPDDAQGDLTIATNEPTGQPLAPPRPRSGGPQGGAGRYRLTITSYEVSPKKKDGRSWDADDSAADPIFYIAQNGTAGVTNPRRLTAIEAATNRRVSRTDAAAWEFDWNGYGPVTLIAWDQDTAAHDLIGAATVNVGQAPAQPTATLSAGWAVPSEPDLFGEVTEIPHEANGQARVTLLWEKIR